MFANNELRGDFRTCTENSASVTPKTALEGLTVQNEPKPVKPQKVKIKTSKSSNRIKNGKSSLSRERAKVVVVKDDDDTYHIIPKESININNQSCKSLPRKITKIAIKRKIGKLKRKSSKGSSNGNKMPGKRKFRKIIRQKSDQKDILVGK